MLFNSVQFAVFFLTVLTLYLCLRHKWQNRMLLVASYVFYGWWDWRFLSLIVISTVIDYFCLSGQTGKFGIFHCSIVYNRFSLNNHSNLINRKLFNQQTIKNNLTGVICQIKNFFRFLYQ